jgi:hypothetical protein
MKTKLVVLFLLFVGIAYSQPNWSTGLVALSSPGSTTLNNVISGGSNVTITYSVGGNVPMAASNNVTSNNSSGLSIDLNSSSPGPANFAQVVFSFNRPYCGLSFNLTNISESISGSQINFRDIVEISATSNIGTNLPNLLVSSGNPTISGNIITTGSNTGAVNVSFPNSCLSSLTIKVYTSTDSDNNPSPQTVSLGNFSNSNNALPLKLLNFNATQDKDLVSLNWSTVEEVNFKHFEVQKSIDGFSFETEAIVSEALRINDDKKLYIFNDPKPKPGANYYRLKLLDQDGTFSYSKIVDLIYNSNQFSFKAFPNPSSLNAGFELNYSQELDQIQFFDQSGREVFPLIQQDKIWFHWPGIYYIKSRSKSAQKADFKVIVQP